MPTYQYACTACGEKLEAVQSFTDDALTECPACNGLLRKVYSAVGVVFKGSGFYKNDSRKSTAETGKTKAEPVTAESGKGGKNGDSGSKSGEGTTKAEPKTDAKPAAALSGTSDRGASKTSQAGAPKSKTA